MLKDILSPTDLKRLLTIGALLLWCAALIAVRMEVSGTRWYAFLGWNLILACIPLAASIALRHAEHRSAPLLMQIALFILWLLFLPNAPYILTDLLHLAPRPYIPMWYDLGMLLSCGGTGLLVGYLSLLDVHGVVKRRMGNVAGWIVATGALLLSGFGIYLGRFLRWNSWEILTNPTGLMADISDRVLHPLSHRGSLGVTLLFGTALVLGYVVMHLVVIGARER